MRYWIVFFLSLLKNSLGSARYVRLTPFKKGKIYFFDKTNLRVFSIHSRGIIDSVTADEVYTAESYSICRLSREQEIKNKYFDILKREKTPLVLDCGANIGVSSQYFHSIFPKARVIGLEPEVSNYEAALDNCWGIDNITLINGGIDSDSGFVCISNVDADANAFQTRSCPSEIQGSVPVFTVEDLEFRDSSFEIFIVKIDIEGAEESLFRANTDWINRCPLMIIELHDWMLPGKANSYNFLGAISYLNRDFVYIGENIFSIKNGDDCVLFYGSD